MRWRKKRVQALEAAELFDRLNSAVEALYAGAVDAATLNATIDELEWGVPQLDDDDPSRGVFLAVLAQAFGLRYHTNQAFDDIDSAVAYGRQAVSAMPDDDPQLSRIAGQLADNHLLRFDMVPEAADLDAVVALGESVLDGTEPKVQAMLAFAHEQRFHLDGTLTDLDAQIRHAERGLELSSEDDESWRVLRESLATGYERRYERARALGDLDAAIGCRETAARERWDDDELRARNLSNVSVDYLERLEVAGDLEDVRRAVGTAIEALDLAGLASPDRADLLFKLGRTYWARYGSSGDVADLDRYVELAAESRQCAPKGGEAVALLNLGVAHVQRYERVGDHDDLDAGIEATEEALALPGLTPDQRAAGIAHLAVMYRRRYEHFGAQADLDHAVHLGERAVRRLPVDHPQHASALIGLSNAYAEVFSRHRDEADMDTAIDLCRRAHASSGAERADRVQLQANLGGLLLERFTANGDPADLDASTEHSELGLADAAADDPRWLELATNLAGALVLRGRLGVEGMPDVDLDRAIDLIERAVAATPPDSRFFLGRLQNLAIAYAEPAVDPERRLEVVRRLVDMVDSSTDSTPTDMASTYTSIGQLAAQAGVVADAAAMWGRGVELLPRCAPQGLSWFDQEHQLSGRGRLVGDAISANLAVGDVSRAVELAELGRSILLSNQLNARADIGALARSAPDLATEFERLVAELDGQSTNEAPGILRAPRRLADRWDRLLNRIREIPELSDFLVPPRIAELQNAAAGGAVVLVNVGAYGADAVLLTPDSVDRIRLPKLTAADAETHANALAGVELAENLTEATIVPTTGATQDLLAWLWESITEPVLVALGNYAPYDDRKPKPRVWWMPTGVLSLLPLHAAGLPGGPSALDLVVSSYTPTIRALMSGRRREPTGTRKQLTVTMTHTEGLPDLLGADDETARLLAKYPGSVALANEDATADAVLAALTEASWVHFACHASSHPVKASSSGLHLEDRGLLVSEIAGVELQGELAYLSACATGQVSVFQADEAAHLASAFQLAGYRHVVATLWSVNDQVAAMASRRFYRLLGDSPTADSAATAVHEATCRLRDRFPHNPEHWAAFVHTGP